MQKGEWHDWRRGGVGSSDSPTILGLTTRTPLQLWLEKTGRNRPQPSDEHLAWGFRLEDDIAEAYTLRTGHGFRGHQCQVALDDLPWFQATLDGIRDDGRIVEFKALGVWRANEFGARDGDWQALPREWIVQVHHQMHAWGGDCADVAVFFPLELRVFTVPRSERLIQAIVDLGSEFWAAVQADEPPRTLDARDAEAIQLAYPTVRDYGVEVPASLADAVGRFQASRDAQAKVELLDFLADAKVGYLPDGRVVKRSVKVRKGYTVPERVEVVLTVERANDVG